MKKPRRTPEQKQAEDKKAREDPLTYKRRDPPIYNPIDYGRYLMAKYKSRNLPTSTPFREVVSQSLYGIPTTERLMAYRQDKERAIESEINREAERQFREELPRPVRNGYEFQILKS